MRYLRYFLLFSLISIVFGCSTVNEIPLNCLHKRQNDTTEYIVHDGFELKYDNTLKIPICVIYSIDGDKLRKREELRLRRPNRFVEDPCSVYGTATSYDYNRSGFDRGHMAPSADMAYSTNTFYQSFYMSNICPQRPECNQKTWKDLEQFVRELAYTNPTPVKVITGPILSDNMDTIGRTNIVSVPNHFFKVLMYNSITNAFVITNGVSVLGFQNYTNSIEKVQELTGLDFSKL